MALVVTHATTATASDAGTGDIHKAEWNANHTLTGSATVAQGGTGAATLAAHGVIIGNGTSAVAVSGAGTTGQVFTSNGASADPTFQAVSAGFTLVGTHTTTGSADATVAFTGLTSNDLIVEFVGVKTNTATGTINFSLSTDNTNYASTSNISTAALTTTASYGSMFLTGLQQGYGTVVGVILDTTTPASLPRINTNTANRTGNFYATAAITAIRLGLSANSFDVGSVINVYGR